MVQVADLISESDMVLLGFGDEFTRKKADKQQIIAAYNQVKDLLENKPWFAVTVNTDDLIYESNLNPFFIVAPCGSEKAGNVVTMKDYDESAYLPQWTFYRNWLASTIGKKLCVLEMGVGMAYPSVIRMPFERTVLWNQKAHMIRIHSKLAQVPGEIADRSLCIESLPVQFLLA